MVGVCTSNDRAEHNGLVGLVLEVGVPQLVEFGTHLLEFLLGWADFKACIDSIRRQSGLFGADLPLVEQLGLRLLHTSEEVIGSDGLVGDAEDWGTLSIHLANIKYNTTYWKEWCNGPGTPHCKARLAQGVIYDEVHSLPNTRKIADDLDAKLVEQLSVTDTRSLKDLRGT